MAPPSTCSRPCSTFSWSRKRSEVATQTHSRITIDTATATPMRGSPSSPLSLVLLCIVAVVWCDAVLRCGVGVKYVPSVIEPSFGIGRILYHVLEHSFNIRPEGSSGSSAGAALADAKILRAFLSLPPHMAPIKVAILPLSAQPQFEPLTSRLLRHFTAAGLSSRADTSGSSIGRRYARCDEVGIPFAVTIDFDSVKDRTVTLRERDSTQQVRLKATEVVDVVARLCRERRVVVAAAAEEGVEESEEERQLEQQLHMSWSQVYATFPQVIRSEAEDS